MKAGVDIEEYDIRYWFMHVALEQAEDTFRVVEGIIETRRELQPKRKRRSDAGQPKEAKTQGLKFPLQDEEIDEECR